MEKRVVADTDFLSAFLKTDKLSVIFSVLDVKKIIIPKAVLKELEAADFYDKLLDFLGSNKDKVIVKPVRNVETSYKFGKGELESIKLAKKLNSLLLMDDRSAGKHAEKNGVIVMDIPTFLLYAVVNSKLSNDDIKQIVSDLEIIDRYRFIDSIKKILIH